MTAVLETVGLSVSYGGLKAVTGVSISVHAGSAVGLIGPNGAGKTSFLDGVTGLTPAVGQVKLSGIEISHLPPHKRARLGLRRTWQSGELFDDLTVLENLAVSGPNQSYRDDLKSHLRAALGATSSSTASEDRIVGALRTFKLEDLSTAMPPSLPLGTQKLVGVARALVAEPPILALDEPAAGLDRFESREFGRHLRAVVDSGTAVLLIDHDMDLVLNVCDHVYVLDFGELIAEGTPNEVRSDSKVRAAYLGHSGRASADRTGREASAR